ncbi:MAG: FAD-dependent oxidoreductase [Candidatus Vogelbacteria bacterium]|nr:FAD-dependent oxidoreductase [Candidatus Vogelbacteria bacterium]
MKSQKKIAIVGAGIAGLSCAYELKKAGFNVTIFESEDTVGGRMQTIKKDGLIVDSGADFFVDRYDLLHSYADELGIKWFNAEEGGKHRIIREGKPHYINLSGPLDLLLNFKLLSLRARIRFLWWGLRLKLIRAPLNFFHLSEVRLDLQHIPAATYLREQISPEVADYVADPFTGIMQFHRVDEISAAALFSLMRMMTESGGFNITYTEGGIAAIPQAIAKILSIKTNTEVISVSSSNGIVKVKHNTGYELFDAVVIATTGNITKNILKNIPISAGPMFENLSYAETMTTSFNIPVNLFSDGTHLTYVPFVENSIVSGYDNQIRKSTHLEHNGRSVLNVYLHEDAAKKLRTKTENEIFTTIISELKKVCPEVKKHQSEVKPLFLKYWPLAMPKFRHDYIPDVTKFEKEGQGEGNIYLAGDYLNSPWTEGAARCGKRVAKMIIDRFS